MKETWLPDECPVKDICELVDALRAGTESIEEWDGMKYNCGTEFVPKARSYKAEWKRCFEENGGDCLMRSITKGHPWLDNTP